MIEENAVRVLLLAVPMMGKVQQRFGTRLGKLVE